MKMPNMALRLTAIPLRSITAGELDHYVFERKQKLAHLECPTSMLGRKINKKVMI